MDKEKKQIEEKIKEIIEADPRFLDIAEIVFDEEIEEIEAEMETAGEEKTEAQTEVVVVVDEEVGKEADDEAEIELPVVVEAELEAAAGKEPEAEVEVAVVTDEEAELATGEEVEVTADEEVEVATDEEAGSVADEEAEETPLPVPPIDDYKKPWIFEKEDEFFAKKSKTFIGRFFRKNRNNAVLGFTILLALLVIAIESISYAIPQTVTIEYVTFAGTETETVETRATEPSEVIEAASFEYSDKVFITPCEGTVIRNGDTIRVLEAEKSTALIGGTESEFWLIPGTVKDNLVMNNISYTEQDRISPGIDETVTVDTKIVVDRVTTTVEVKKEEEQPKNYVILDPSLESGKQEVTEGKAGEGYFKYTTTYVNGEFEGTERTVKKWITEPVDNTLRLGTSLTGHSGKYEATRTFTANTTAYWMGDNARGAAGGRCVYGTCAVDPSIIPYGTLIWVEGYGAAVANDCGSGIKGDDLDLWMHSYEESCQWGRRFVTSYVLKAIE